MSSETKALAAAMTRHVSGRTACDWCGQVGELAGYVAHVRRHHPEAWLEIQRARFDAGDVDAPEVRP